MFSTQSVLHFLYPPSSPVIWHRLLGGKFGIPRHNFILWLAFLERLSTLDRISSSSMGQQCVLCGGQQVETHQHLFFRCSFTKRCLEILKRNVRFSWLNMGWQTDITWASRRWRGRHVLNEASRALLASIVYHVWSERNSRIFSDTASSAETVACRALEELRRVVVMEVEPPSVVRYLIGAAIMMLGVVLPVGYMMFRNKRVPSSSSYSKQTKRVDLDWTINLFLQEQGFDIELFWRLEIRVQIHGPGDVP
ncbi:UNVERIFIED_CONTAM: hypothetical protein Sradi_5699200 [Sesamum radiatum]|uniref:Reverse transcriptase zinc-binding domain-containing protein n=1 Tax=Sesamum radiatum TaxID=300843 RepID=A0AAW2L317_SESRA